MVVVARDEEPPITKGTALLPTLELKSVAVETSNPEGGVMVTDPFKLAPETSKLEFEEGVPYEVAIPAMVPAIVTDGQLGATVNVQSPEAMVVAPVVFQFVDVLPMACNRNSLQPE